MLKSTIYLTTHFAEPPCRSACGKIYDQSTTVAIVDVVEADNKESVIYHYERPGVNCFTVSPIELARGTCANSSYLFTAHHGSHASLV